MHHIADLFVWYLVFVFSTTCHEAAHAWVAYRGGDLTAHAGGHVSLDPVPHIRRSPFGMVVIPIASFLLAGMMVGWASVPLNSDWAKRHPRRAALMALSGPAANLSLALIAFLAIRSLVAGGVLELPGNYLGLGSFVTVPEGAATNSMLGALARGLSVMLGLNVILGLFNLLPLPPLDGAAVVEGAAPRAGGKLYAMLREVPMFELLSLLLAWKVFPMIATPAIIWVATMLYV
jgi:Zn-dependent protease